MYVIVKSIDVFGKIKFAQDIARLNKEHYHEGKLYAFDVIDVKEDHNTNATYYELEDDFTTHRFYFNGKQKYQKGDSCILEVAGVNEKGNLKLKEVKHTRGEIVEKAVEELKDNTKDKLSKLWESLPVLDVEDEGQTLELKTSIAFPPGEGKANIGKQLYTILKELTAFMNTEGGTLYIGIHDKTKKVIGIEGDFQFLNSDEEDEYNGSYKEDKDGYELKIRNTMDRLCPSLANSLTTISFESLEGHVFCKIEVKPARRPIFLSGTQLYVRQGNRIKILKGDEITFFITERMDIAIKNMIDTEGLTNRESLSADELRNLIRELLNERRAIPMNLPKPKDLGEIDYWLVWYNDGTWKKTRNKEEGNDVYIQVPVFKNLNASLVAFCYETRVNTVKLNDFKKRANMNKLQTKNWWSRTGEKPKQIFVSEPTDYVAGYSIDSNGIEYVKLHAISDYTPSATPGAQGGTFAPDNARVETYAIIGAEHRKRVEHLIVKKADRSKNAGTPLTSPVHKDEIEYLEKVLKN
jgi:hypothetical protein